MMIALTQKKLEQPELVEMESAVRLLSLSQTALSIVKGNMMRLRLTVTFCTVAAAAAAAAADFGYQDETNLIFVSGLGQEQIQL